MASNQKRRANRSRQQTPRPAARIVRFEERRRAAIRNLGAADVRIGRDPTCDWIVDYANVSRQHAVVRPLGDRNVVLDLGSTNGVRVNGELLGGKPHVLEPGDLIELTEAVVLLYEEGPFTSSTPWVATAVAMVVLLIASIGLYLATRRLTPEAGTAPGEPPAVSSGPESAAPGTHLGMPSAHAPRNLEQHREPTRDFRVRGNDWYAQPGARSSGGRRRGTGREGDPL